MKRYIAIFAILFVPLLLSSVVQAGPANYVGQNRNGYLETREVSTGYLCDVTAGHVYYEDFNTIFSRVGTGSTASSIERALIEGITVTAVNSGTARSSSAGLALTTGATAHDNVEVAVYDNSFTGAKYAVAEARIASQTTQTAWFFGFTDAITEGADDLPFEKVAGTASANADDAVGFLFETFNSTADGSQPVCYAYIKDAGTATVTATDELITAIGEAHMYRVELYADGAAKLYIDNALVKSAAAASTDYSQGYYPYFGAMSRSTAADPVTATYISAWRKK
jgi:hypothetical protein